MSTQLAMELMDEALQAYRDMSHSPPKSQSEWSHRTRMADYQLNLAGRVLGVIGAEHATAAERFEVVRQEIAQLDLHIYVDDGIEDEAPAEPDEEVVSSRTLVSEETALMYSSLDPDADRAEAGERQRRGR